MRGQGIGEVVKRQRLPRVARDVDSYNSRPEGPRYFGCTIFKSQGLYKCFFFNSKLSFIG